MDFLSIDFSTDIGSLYIKVKNKTFNKVLQSDKSNNDLLIKKTLDFFNENNLKFDDVSKIFVNQGPGNFSGLRSSIAMAKGLSLSKNIKLFGYNTFIWSCAKFLNEKKNIYSIIKFREKYYVKNFDNNFNSVSISKEVSKDQIIKNYNNKFLVVPKNMQSYFDKKILALSDMNIADLDHNNLELLQLKGLLDEDLIKPLYLS
jgi:tRNA threonylcarbamoyl adenosine modification protein YeaZ